MTPRELAVLAAGDAGHATNGAVSNGGSGAVGADHEPVGDASADGSTAHQD